MRVVVIGATGHVGGYLVPRLVRAGHEVIAISRNTKPAYRDDPAWSEVRALSLDREVLDAAGTFGETIASLDVDVVIDMICFSPESARLLVDALRGRVSQLVMCTTIWVKGYLSAVPAREDDPSEPWGDYGRGKAAIEELLRVEASRPDGLRSTCLRPGHISGPGWRVVNPQGNFGLDAWEKLAAGEQVVLPGLGLETVHHVHADDVAQAFELAIDRVDGEGAERFNVVSEQAMTLRGFAEAVAGGFGRQAELAFTGLEAFLEGLDQDDAVTSREHIARSHSMSIDKARLALGYRPKYSSLQAVQEAVNWLREEGTLSLGGRRFSG